MTYWLFGYVKEVRLLAVLSRSSTILGFLVTIRNAFAGVYCIFTIMVLQNDLLLCFQYIRAKLHRRGM